jgi:hypothetical protein
MADYSGENLLKLSPKPIFISIFWGGRGPVRDEMSFLHVVQTGSGAQLAFYPVSTGCYFPGDKEART